MSLVTDSDSKQARPTHLRLTPTQHERAERLARELAVVGDVSKGDVFRAAIDRGLDVLERERVRATDSK